MKTIPVIFGSHGVELHGTVMLPDNADASNPVPGAVLCHGLGGTRSVMEPGALLMVGKGIATIIFDLRGHGVSKGSLDDAFYEDVIDAWQVLIDIPEVDSGRVALVGHSLGALSSILAARKIQKPKVLVSLSCPYEIGGMLMKYTPRNSFFLLRWIFVVIIKLVLLFRGVQARVDWKKFLNSWLQPRLSSALEELEECTKLFVFCAGDPLTSYRKFVPIYESAPGLKQKMLARGYHTSPVRAEFLRFEWVGWTVSELTSRDIYR
ncbi:MAG: alpha/beta fold hydrolase [Dehalococcoidia bacterium]